MNIHDIESLTMEQAKAISLEAVPVKDSFLLYLADFGDPFGYSSLVFTRDGAHICYANDYALHHSRKTRQELREWYIEKANNILFTEEELAGPILNYEEYSRKDYFIRNYLPMCFDHMSIFAYCATEEEERKRNRELKKHPYYCPPAFAWFRNKEDADRINRLFETLEQRKSQLKDDFAYNKDAFYREMANHEYHINYYQGDFDVLSAFGTITWAGEDAPLSKYFDELKFSDVQRKAYFAARKDFLRDAADWY